jgi:hypothetical protein
MKRNLYLLGMLLIVQTCGYSQSQGPQDPLSASYSAFGCLACSGGEWNDFQNVSYVDHQYATAGLAAYPSCFQSTCFYSRILFAHDFGFTIPAGAVITGITARILRMSTLATGVADSAIRLYTGTPVGINHAVTTYWTPNPMAVQYGDSTDTWGNSFTPDSVNSAQFGLSVQVMNKNISGSFATASVDHIEMTVYYSTGTGIQSQTKSSCVLEIYYDRQAATLTLYSKTGKISAVSITDITGNEIFSAKFPAQAEKTVRLELRLPASGIYFMTAEADGKTVVQKFIAE